LWRLFYVECPRIGEREGEQRDQRAIDISEMTTSCGDTVYRQLCGSKLIQHHPQVVAPVPRGKVPDGR
jgi:hypothetical protein